MCVCVCVCLCVWEGDGGELRMGKYLRLIFVVRGKKKPCKYLWGYVCFNEGVSVCEGLFTCLKFNETNSYKRTLDLKFSLMYTI